MKALSTFLYHHPAPSATTWLPVVSPLSPSSFLLNSHRKLLPYQCRPPQISITPVSPLSITSSSDASPQPLHQNATAVESLTQSAFQSSATFWDVPSHTRPTLYIVDTITLLHHVQRAFSVSAASSRQTVNIRVIHAFSIVLTSLLKQHVCGAPVLTVFPAFTRLASDGVSSPVAAAIRICYALGLAVVRAETTSFRPCDIIATVVHTARRSGVRSVIVSADSLTVLYSLLDDPWVHALILRHAGLFETITVRSLHSLFRVNIHPRQIFDVLALVTNNHSHAQMSSSIPAHTALKLITYFGSLDSLLDTANACVNSSNPAFLRAISPLTPRLAKRIVENQRQYRQLRVDIGLREVFLLPVDWLSVQRGPVNVHDVIAIVKSLKISSNSLVNRLLHSAEDVACNPHGPLSTIFEEAKPSSNISIQSQSTPDIRRHSSGYIINPSGEQINSFLKDVQNFVSILPVFDDASDREPRLRAVSVCRSPGSVILIQLSRSKTLPDSVVHLLTCNTIEKRGWFLKNLTKALISQYGVVLAGSFFDNHVAAHLLLAGSHLSDSDVASRFLAKGNFLGECLTRCRVHKLSLDHVSDHPLELCDVGFSLSKRLRKEIVETGLSTIMFDIESPLVVVLSDMEARGAPIDTSELFAVHEKLRRRRIRLRARLKAALAKSPHLQYGGGSLLSSKQDLLRILSPSNGKDKLERTVKNVPGRLKINQSILLQLANDQTVDFKRRRFARLLLRYRQVTQLMQIYTVPLLSSVGANGRVYPTFVQLASSNGRLSTSKPNLQSLPARSIIGGALRRIVKARDGACIVTADYSQIELRIVSSMSNDANLLTAFSSCVDVHKQIAAELFGLSDTSLVSEEQRTTAKMVVYSILYGVSSKGLAKRLGIARRDAELLISNFFKSFPQVKLLTEKLVEEAVATGYAKTLSGRRRHIAEIIGGNNRHSEKARRVAINMPVQGTQADMLKLAMTRIWKRLITSRSRLIMQLHDELILEVDKSERDMAMLVVSEEMVNAVPLNGVDIVVKVGCGETWLDAVSSAQISKTPSKDTLVKE